MTPQFDPALHAIHELYGLSFFVLGVVLVVLPKLGATLGLARRLNWLAAFGLLHGSLEFVEGARLHASSVWLEGLSNLLLAASFLALLEFGRRAGAGLGPFDGPLRLRGLPVYAAAAAGVALLTLLASDPSNGLRAGIRLFVGAPGGLLAGMALLSVRHGVGDPPMRDWLKVAALTLMVYALFTPFDARPDPNLPWMASTAGFADATGLPVQLPRALCALLLAFAFVAILRRANEQAQAAALDPAVTQASKEKYRTLFDAMEEGYCLREMIFDDRGKGIDYRFLEVNAAFERQFGIQGAQGKPVEGWVEERNPANGRHRWVSAALQPSLLATAQPISTGEPKRFRNDSAELGRWFDVYAFPIGKPGLDRFAARFTDITARQRLEAQLRTSESHLQALLDAVLDGIVSIDARGIIRTVNPAMEQIFGYRSEELLGQSVNLLMPEPQAHEHDGHIRRYLQTAKAHIVGSRREVVGRRKDGSLFHLEIAVNEVRTGDEVVFIGVLRDLTEQKRAELEYKSIIEASSDGFWMIGRDGGFIDVNPAACRMSGYSRAELLAMSVADIDAVQSPEEILGIIEAPRRSGPVRFESRHRRKDGQLIDVEVVVMALDTRGGIVVSFSRDLSERLKDRQALAASEQRLRRRIDGMLPFIGVFDLDGRLVEINQAALRLSGERREDVLGKHLWETSWWSHSPEIRDTMQDALRRAAAGQAVRGDYLAWAGKIGYLTVDVLFSPLHGENGEVIEIVASGVDVTARHNTEQALRKANRAYRVLSAMNQRIVQAEEEAELLRWICEIPTDLGGYRLAWVGRAEDDRERSVRPLAHAGSASGYMAELKVSWDEHSPLGQGPTGRAIRTGATQVKRIADGDADFLPWQAAARKHGFASGISIPMAVQGRIWGALMLYSEEPDAFEPAETELLEKLAADVTYALGALQERRAKSAAERALRLSENQWTAAMDAFQDPTYLLDAERRFVRGNKAFHALARATAQELAGRPIAEILHPQGEAVPCPVCQAQMEKRDAVITLEADHPDNPAGVPIEVSCHIIREPDGTPTDILMSLHDLTRTRQEQEQLRLSEARLAEAQKIARLGNWNWDIQGGALSWSDEVYRIFGLNPQAFGATYEAFLARVHPDDRHRVREAVDQSLRAVRPYAIDHRIRLPDGSIRFVHEQGEVRFDEHGQPLRMIGTVQDITERKVAEMAMLRTLNEKDVLLGELHHRVKNNLQVVSSMLSLQTRHITADNVAQALSDSRERIRSAAILHERLYAADDLGRVDLLEHARYLAERLARLHHQAGQAAQVRVSGVSLPLKLEQALPCALILYELITNALRHTGQGQAAPDIEIVTSRPVEGAIHISVRDRGPGPGGWNENIESAKTLGLTIVRALVKQLRGHIEFRPGQPGTDIVLTVPAQASPQEKEQHDG